jgi:hypothetical protein
LMKALLAIIAGGDWLGLVKEASVYSEMVSDLS